MTDNKQALARIDVTEGLAFADMVRMGDVLVKTGFLPAHINNGAQFAAIVLAGRELGMLPMRALRSMQMIKGKVTEGADSQLARFKAAGGRATFKTLTRNEAVLELTHPNGDKHTETFDMDDAMAAGLTGGNWQKFPKAMLRSRAITAGLKSIGWEGAVGAYDPDELAQATPPTQRVTHKPSEQGRSAVQPTPRRNPVTVTTIEAKNDHGGRLMADNGPPVEEEEVIDAEVLDEQAPDLEPPVFDEDGDEVIDDEAAQLLDDMQNGVQHGEPKATKQQNEEIKELLTLLGIAEDDKRARYFHVAATVGRKDLAKNPLSMGEADRLISELDKQLNEMDEAAGA